MSDFRGFFCGDSTLQVTHALAPTNKRSETTEPMKRRCLAPEQPGFVAPAPDCAMCGESPPGILQVSEVLSRYAWLTSELLLREKQPHR